MIVPRHQIVPPQQLRAFYEETFDRGESPRAYASARDADEFLRLASLVHPHLTPRGARSLAPPHLRSSIDDFPANRPTAPELRVQEVVAERIDLDAVDARTDAEAIVLKGANWITSWSALGKWPGLRHFSLVQCTAADLGPVTTALTVLEELRAYEVPVATAKALLDRTATSSLEIVLTAGTFDARWIKEVGRLRRLSLSGERVVHAGRLRPAPLEELSFTCRRLPAETLDVATAAGSTLSRLHVSSSSPFVPDELVPAAAPALRLVLVPAFTEHRAAWIDFAMSRPHVGFVFSNPSPAEPVRKVVGVHRQLPISKIGTGKRAWYEAVADLAELWGLEGDNGDVEDALRAALADIPPGSLASGADEMVITGASKSAVKEVIDRAYEALGRPAGTADVKPSRT
jgi:hypothetical protein